VAAAARAGGLAPGPGPVAAYTSACLAGADLPEDEQELARLVQAEGWSAAGDVVNDTFAVLRAGLDPAPGATPWGAAVTCGAGINCVAVAPDGRTTRYLALGPLSGDWGGGWALSLAAIGAAARAADGRGPQTRLREDVARYFGVPDIQDAIIAMYRGQIAESELHGLVPLLFAAASAGDEAAVGLLRRLAGEIVIMVAAAAWRLGLAGEAVPVVLGGSVLAARDPLLTSLIESGLAEAMPRAVPHIVDVPPVTGAALLGLDHTAAPPEAGTRLREAFRTALPLAIAGGPGAGRKSASRKAARDEAAREAAGREAAGRNGAGLEGSRPG
jgi:N-acetylglucosamine kinase-like BadF-type ATPase